MSAVKAAGVFWLHALSLCARTFGCTCVAKTHHQAPPVRARGSNVWPVTHHWAIWRMGMDPKWSENVLTVETSVKNAWRITVWTVSQNSLHSTHFRTKLYYGIYISSSSRTKTYLSFKDGFKMKIAYSVFPRCIPNPISISSSKTFPSLKHTFVPTHRGVTSSFCPLVWDEISLFHTRQGFITIPSASPCSPPPPSHTLCTITICVSLKWSVLTSQCSVVSILNLSPTCWPRWLSQWELQRVCVRANFHVCQWCGSVCHEKGCISAASHRTKVGTAGGLALHHAPNTCKNES